MPPNLEIIEVIKKAIEKAKLDRAPGDNAATKNARTLDSLKKNPQNKGKDLESKEGHDKNQATYRSKEPDKQAESKHSSASIQEKFKEQLDRKGQPLTVQEKLHLIGQEMPVEVKAQTQLLNEQYQKLRLVIEESPASPTSRKEIENVIAHIPQNMYWDEALGGVASEIQQIAFSHILRNPAYMAEISIDDRAVFGQTFFGVRADRVYDDEAYLRSKGETTEFRTVTPGEIKSDRVLAKDIEQLATNESNLTKIEDALRTLQPSETLTLADAQKKIDKGPQWLKDAAKHVNGNVHAATMLAKLADVAVIDPDALNDKAYMFMKTAQLAHIGMDIPKELQDTKTMGEISKLNRHLVEQGKISDSVSEANRRNLLYPEQREGMATAPSGKSKYEWDPNEDPSLLDSRFDAFRDKIEKTFNKEISEDERKINEERNKKTKDQDKKKIGELQQAFDSKIIDILAVDIPQMNEEEFAVITKTHFFDRLENYRSGLVQKYIDEGRGYNSLYVPESKIRAYQLNPLKEVRNELDRYTRMRRLLPNRFQQAADRSFEMNMQYLQSDEYRQDVKKFVIDRLNWPDIKTVTGHAVDPDNPEAHPLYQRMFYEDRYEAFRQKIVDATYVELLEKNYTSWELGKLEEMGPGTAGFGEPGIMAVLRNRAINTDSFDVLETLYDNIRGPNGEQVVASGPVQQKVLKEAVEFLWTHKDLIEPKFIDEYGPGAILTRADIQSSVEEAHMLLAVTGQRAKAARRCLTQIEGGGQGVNPHPFAGESSGDNKLNQSIQPIRQFLLRWNVVSAVQRVWVETIARLEARRYGVDTKWKKIIDAMDTSKSSYEDFVKNAFLIQSDDNDHIRDCLGGLKYNRFGLKRIDAPTKIKDITKEDLKRWLIMRDGIRLAEPQLMAAYSYFDVGWNIAEMTNIYDEQFGKNQGIGVLERLRNQISGLFDATKDHRQLEEIKENLVKRDDANRKNDGGLIVAARYMPIHTLRALDNQQSDISEKFIHDHIDNWNIFKDEFSNGLTYEKEGIANTQRKDLFYKRYELAHTMINRGLADWEDRSNEGLMKLEPDDPGRLRAKGLSSVDWSAGVITNTHQSAVVEKVCEEMHIKPEDFIRVSKELSDFALRKDVLDEASHPFTAHYFLDVRKLDARLCRLDEGPSKLEKVFPEDKKDIPEWFRKQYVGKWSERIANVTGHGISGGLSRFIGDQMNVWKVLVPELVPLSKARNTKEWEQHFDRYIETVVNTGGNDARGKVAQTLTLAYIMPNRMDLRRDLLGTSDDTHIEVTVNQRIAGKGYQALTMNDADHVLHHGEAAAGVKFHEAFPHMDHVTQKEAGMILTLAKWPKFINTFGEAMGKKLPNTITIGGETFHHNFGRRVERYFTGELTIKTVWVYRVLALFGLGAVIVALQAAENAKKGFSESTGSGGGGGSQPQHH